jgi:putative flavoprotein involved in K+ transport
VTDISDRRHAVIVIGAGQAGLAAAHQLGRRGIDFVVLEADDRIGDVWRRRYDSLRLYSPAKYDALPGLAFPLPAHAFPTGRQMGDYLEAYARHHELPVRTGVRVHGLRAASDGGGYVVSAGTREYRADQVIVATGGFQRPRVPAFADSLNPAIRQLHSSEYRGPQQLADGPVLVVGLSHSGSDIAYEAATSGHETFVSGTAHGQLPFSVDSRRARVAWPLLRFVASNVLTLATPIGRRMAPKVRRGGGPLLRVRRDDLLGAGVSLRAARTTGADDAGRPMLADGTVVDVANVIWCTGFRPDHGWVRLPIFGADGWPMQRRGVVETAPGIYMLGLPFLFGFTSMLVVGAARDARYVVDRVAARASERSEHASARVRSTAA